MADPLSITASVIALLTFSIQVSSALQKFRDEVSGVDATLSGLINDVTSFQHVLESMKVTFDQDDVKLNLHDTGHVGAHYRNLATSIEDGGTTLSELLTLLDGVIRLRASSMAHGSSCGTKRNRSNCLLPGTIPDISSRPPTCIKHHHIISQPTFIILPILVEHASMVHCLLSHASKQKKRDEHTPEEKWKRCANDGLVQLRGAFTWPARNF
jgi:hypothetical protein